jgi:uncharacterized metal-binding protein YceD (DUF177 family)
MSAPVPEFSRPVALARVGAEPFHQRIEATAEEREKLSRRFDLVTLDRLVAEVVLRRQSTGLILLEAEFSATFEQCCVVTLEPVPGTISSRFSLVCGLAPENEPEIDVSDDEPVFEPVTGDSIDIGEAVAQELSLTLPAFPRDPEAIIDQAATAKPFEGPFAALARREDPECREC